MTSFIGTNQNPHPLLIEGIRREVKKLSVPGRYRLTAEILLKDGSRWIYRAKAIDKDSALAEILTFVNSVEENIGERVMWRLRGESTYHMGVNFTLKKKKSIIDKLISFFFPELDEEESLTKF